MIWLISSILWMLDGLEYDFWWINIILISEADLLGRACAFLGLYKNHIKDSL